MEFCKDNNIILRKNYDNENIVRDTIIKAKCIRCDNNMKEKNFRDLVRSKNFGCIDCLPIIKQERAVATNIEIYGCKNAGQNEEVKEKMKQTNLKKYGVEYVCTNKDIQGKIRDGNLKNYQNPETRDKRINKWQNTNIERLGVKTPLQNQAIKEKMQQTNLERYGNKSPLSNPEIKEKINQTNLERYGSIYPLNNPKIIEKRNNTNIERFGHTNALDNDEIKEKAKETNRERYGCDYASQNLDIKNRVKETNMKNYGTEYPMQNAAFAEKVSKNAYKSKEYELPSGKIIKIQGYENFGLDRLLKVENTDENHVITSRSQVPEVWWQDNNGIKHRYYIDVFITSQNRGIEIKSTWTYEKNYEAVLLKQQAFIDAGYTCEIWVYDGKGNRVLTC
jgi:hypothetical protein